MYANYPEIHHHPYSRPEGDPLRQSGYRASPAQLGPGAQEQPTAIESGPVHVRNWARVMEALDQGPIERLVFELEII